MTDLDCYDYKSTCGAKNEKLMYNINNENLLEQEEDWCLGLAENEQRLKLCLL